MSCQPPLAISSRLRSLKTVGLVLVLGGLLQGCSWLHRLEIRNDTNTVWKVEYRMLDSRGIFKPQVYVQKKGTPEGELIVFKDDTARFALHPGETVRVGMARNAHYKFYKNETQYDAEIPWKPFLNVAEVCFISPDSAYKIPANALEKAMSKNTREVARIEMGRVLEALHDRR